MSVSPFDSALYRELFCDLDTARLFTDSAEIRAMLLVLGALARAQGQLGLISEVSAAAILRATMEVQIDPGSLAAETGRNGVAVPALVAGFRAAMQAPEHARFVHFGATSQDIIDTALVLRLRQALALIEAQMTRLDRALAELADNHAATPMAGRSYGQHATPTSFGAVVAAWGQPVLRHRARLSPLRDELLVVSLSGAAGTSAALGPQAAEVSEAMAQALDLRATGDSWHSARDRVGALAGWLTGLAGSLGKMGHDLVGLTQTEIAEITLSGAGSSSTMPQKQNPVGPSVLQALAAHVAALNTAVQGAAIHAHQRDGAAWFTEWLSLPAMVVGTARAIRLAADVAEGMVPNPQRMAANMEAGLGMIHAEAISFALAAHMPRPEAQSEIKALCAEAHANNTPLPVLAAQRFPQLDLASALSPERSLGQAPALARAYASAARVT